MKAEQHDFTGNLTNAMRFGESEKARKMILNEIGELIHFHRGHAITALNEAGIQTNKDAKDKEITDKLAEGLRTNPKLVEILSTYIAHFNVSGEQYMNADHEGGHESAGAAAANGAIGGAATGGVIGSIAGAIGSIFGFAKSSKDAKTQSEADKNALALALISARNQNGGGSSTGKTIGIVAVVSIAIGTAIYFATRKA